MTTKYGDNAVVMEDTGLKDKNGKTIWEGDIVEYIHYNVKPQEIRKVKVVKHRIGDGGLYNGLDVYYPFVDVISGSYRENGRQISECYLTPPSECEVIGNVYENPNIETRN